LIDYTIEQCAKIGIPRSQCVVSEIYDHQKHQLVHNTKLELPVHPTTNKPILFAPKRWLRHSPWLNFETYFRDYIPKDDRYNTVTWDKPALLLFNRENFGVVDSFIKLKERTAADCAADPLFSQIPILSAKRKLHEIEKLPSGKDNNSDRKYEDAAASLLSSMLYPHLDFADTQVRTDSGTQIRDLIFYMNRDIDFLKEIEETYAVKQLVVEMKNVKALEREHVNQLYRYLSGPFGRLGVFLTRNEMPRSIRKNTIDLWSSKRVCLLPITDEDLRVMVDVFETKQRNPLDVLKRAYVKFQRECPA